MKAYERLIKYAKIYTTSVNPASHKSQTDCFNLSRLKQSFLPLSIKSIKIKKI